MMILPILVYRSTVKISFTTTQKNRLKSLERRATVIIGKEVQSVINIINREACSFIRKCLDENVCSNYLNYFTINKHSRNTRNSGHLLKLPRVKLEIGKSSFMFAGAKLYNNLPIEIRKLEDSNVFIKEIKRYFN